MYPGDARMENFILAIRAFAGSRISGFLFHTHQTEDAARMPETYEDLTYGLTRNPATKLGYTVSEDGIGSFKVGVKPEDFQWAFVFNKGKEEFEIRRLDIDSETSGTEAPIMLKPGDEGYSREGFTWILSDEDFI